MGETVSWSRDFQTVDAAAVTTYDNFPNLDEQNFSTLGYTWTVTQCSGAQVVLKVDQDGNTETLKWANKETFVEKAKKIRIEEFDQQVLYFFPVILTL